MDKLTIAFKTTEKEVKKFEDVSLVSFSGEQVHIVFYNGIAEPKIEKVNLSEVMHMEIK